MLVFNANHGFGAIVTRLTSLAAAEKIMRSRLHAAMPIPTDSFPTR